MPELKIDTIKEGDLIWVLRPHESREGFEIHQMLVDDLITDIYNEVETRLHRAYYLNRQPD